MLDACLPFGPWVTSNETFCPSLSVLNPCMLIAEKWANRSSPPPSGVMNPKPFASLNHLTVPVAILRVPLGFLNGCPAGSEDRRHSGAASVPDGSPEAPAGRTKVRQTAL